MQAFKNLMKANLYTEEALQNFNKKTEQIRKVTNGPLEQFQALVSATESTAILLEKWLVDQQACESEDLKKSAFWLSLIQTCKKLNIHQTELGARIRTQFVEASRQIKNNSILQLQKGLDFMSKVKMYKSKEHMLLETQKKYAKLFKLMLSNIENYKKTFTDVKMVYNKQEKIKKYLACELNYDELMKEHTHIIETISFMSQSKLDIFLSFKDYAGSTSKGVTNIGGKILGFSKKYLELCCQKESLYVNILTADIEKIQKTSLQFQFCYPITDNESQQYLKPGNSQKHPFIPRIIMNYHLIKQTHYLHLGILLVNYQKELGELIRKRKNFNRQLLENVGYFSKAYQKISNMNKEFLNSYQKRKKKFVEFYRIQSFFSPAFSKVIATLERIHQKNVKKLNLKYKTIEQILNQQCKIFEILQKEFKINFMQKFVSKKEIKKKSSFQRVLVEVQIEVKNKQQQILKMQTFQKMVQLNSIFQGSYQKIKKNCRDLKEQIESILLILEKSTVEIYTCIKAQTQLEKQNNQRIKKKEGQIDAVSLVRAKIFEESIFSDLFNQQTSKITFDGDLNKVEEFKKLKKPQELLEEQLRKETNLDQQTKNKEKQEKQENESLKRKDLLNQQENDELEIQNKQQISLKVIKQETIQEQRGQNTKKYQRLLNSRIKMLTNEKYIKSYVCGLAYNIILSGRLYITNERLCFYSKFNPKNIFFGETFIEIPKKDIKKIEKRQNALVFDNSISVTTVHGEMFFTSFFSRNQAYDKILQALQLNLEDIMYEPEQIREIVIQQEIIREQEDDIKQPQLVERQKKIDALLKKNDYKEIMNTTLTFKDLTALKYFKLFWLDQQISYNRGKFSNFQGYFKNLLGYSELNSQDWEPNIIEYFNSSNIKADTPLSITKKFKQVVPVVNSGIPFMPKTSKIEQNMTVYFYSKDRIVFETQVRSAGVPYCDYFYITFKKEVTTSQPNSIAWKTYYSITFVTNTMIKGVIETRSFEQSKISMKKLEEEMKKYLKYLERVSSKSIASQPNIQAGKQHSSNENSQVEGLSLQIEELNKQKEVLAASLKIQKNINTKNKKILLVSVLVNIALLLILMI